MHTAGQDGTVTERTGTDMEKGVETDTTAGMTRAGTAGGRDAAPCSGAGRPT